MPCGKRKNSGSGQWAVGSDFIRLSSPKRERRVCLLNVLCVGSVTDFLTVAARGKWEVGSVAGVDVAGRS
jgi:hypothetical protein